MANQGRRSISAKYQRYAREYWQTRSGERVTKKEVAEAVQRFFGLDWQPHRSTVTRWLQGDPSWGKTPEPDPKRIDDIDDPVIRSRLEDTPEGFERFFNAYSDLVLRPHSKMFVQAAFSYAGECSKCGEPAAWEVRREEGGGHPVSDERGTPVIEGVARAPSTAIALGPSSVLGSGGSGEGMVSGESPEQAEHLPHETPDPDAVDPESGLLPSSSHPLSDEDGGGEGQPARGPLLLCDAHVHRSDMRLRPGAKLVGRWKPSVLINIAANFSKSTCWSIWMPTWRLTLERAHGRPYRMILLSQTDFLAKEFGTAIASIMVENETMIRDFGRFKPPDPPANTWMLGLVGFRIDGSGLDRGFSLLSRGSGQQVEGLRADEIVADDVVHPKRDTKTEQARKDLSEWFGGVITTRLAENGKTRVVGSKVHAEDLYKELAEQTGLDGEPIYEHIIFPALIDPATGEGSLAADAVSLWPHPPELPECDGRCCRTRAFLDKQYGKMGRDLFMLRYQQVGRPPGSTIFDEKWIYGDEAHPGCIDKGRSLGESRGLIDPRYSRPVVSRVLSYDPSGGTGYAAWIVMDIPLPENAAKPKYEPAIIDLGRERTGMRGFVKRTEWAAATYGPIDYLVFEAGAGGFKAFLEDIELAEVLSRYDIQVVRHATGTNVHDRDNGVTSLQIDLERGRIRLPGGADRDESRDEGVRTRMQVKLWIDDFLAYPWGETKDFVLASWFPKWNLRRILPRRRVPTGTGRLAVPARLQGKRWAAG